MIDAEEALDRLREGNRRFVAGAHRGEPYQDQARHVDLSSGQTPFAVVLGCSDSRAPVEILFDQRPGDLFVVRVAGNIAKPTQVGSIEFAVNELGVRLVVVLGHSDCGAIRAALRHRHDPAPLTPGLNEIIETIAPVIGGIGSTDEAIWANVRAVVSGLHHAEGLRDHVDRGALRIVGAKYAIDTGCVEFKAS